MRAGGPFPLVIFAHGNTVSDPAEAYAGLLRKWANSGYVIVAPTFPVSSTRVPGGLADLVNQPADVSFVLTQMLQLSAAADGRYKGLIDQGRIAVAGHSLGGMTALGVTANTCCSDDRIKAAIVLAGEERSFGRGSFFTGSGRVPTMVVHGDADATIPFEAGHKVFADASRPKVMLTLVGGDHGAPYSGAESYGPARLVAAATLDFLDYYVRGDAQSLDRLRAAVAGSPNAHLEVEEEPS
ncbi:MAG TPA: hypothetical protein VM121_02270 [Acidimicrobiales bacterium]|nr:hypothetical protein [Acidimicrobiales bacterium]